MDNKKEETIKSRLSIQKIKYLTNRSFRKMKNRRKEKFIKEIARKYCY